MRPIWWFLIGAVIMFVVLKMLAGKTISTSSTSTNFMVLVKTPQASNLVKTNEFRELVKTSAFKKLMLSLADDELKAMSQTLVGANKIY